MFPTLRVPSDSEQATEQAHRPISSAKVLAAAYTKLSLRKSIPALQKYEMSSQGNTLATLDDGGEDKRDDSALARHLASDGTDICLLDDWFRTWQVLTTPLWTDIAIGGTEAHRGTRYLAGPRLSSGQGENTFKFQASVSVRNEMASAQLYRGPSGAHHCAFLPYLCGTVSPDMCALDPHFWCGPLRIGPTFVVGAAMKTFPSKCVVGMAWRVTYMHGRRRRATKKRGCRVVWSKPESNGRVLHAYASLTAATDVKQYSTRGIRDENLKRMEKLEPRSTTKVGWELIFGVGEVASVRTAEKGEQRKKRKTIIRKVGWSNPEPNGYGPLRFGPVLVGGCALDPHFGEAGAAIGTSETLGCNVEQQGKKADDRMMVQARVERAILLYSIQEFLTMWSRCGPLRFGPILYIVNGGTRPTAGG
ncbi:hypothetical protein DFH08DRAFT_997221 [Mycena albidolilacea]|uniref:Uncharacterized protein n=1 Tax=Mycena albidolilacea TaxID=1033008 RepID=A0AAD7EU78_9AGAR|nr:hypothetical protein DFH08DRAFT_997221 [Mycena albidolilacea]